MKRILVPIDFSPTSINAFYYAGELAKAFGASIELVHVNDRTIKNNGLPIHRGKSNKNLLEELKTISASLPQYSDNIIEPKTKVNCQILEDLTVDAILEEIVNMDADMVIMGTTGSHSVLERAIGSISISVAQAAPCPVLMIPTGFKYQSYENILYALDYEALEEKILKETIDFANLFRSALHFVHVGNKKETTFNLVEEALFEALFEKGNPSFAFNILTVSNKSVVKGLNDYIKDNAIDMAVLINHHKHFLDNLMGKSMTKQMGLYTKIPLMIYPSS